MDRVAPRSLNLRRAARGAVVFPPRGAAGAGLCVLPLVAFCFRTSSLLPSRRFSLSSFFVELLSRNTSRVATSEQAASSDMAPKKDQLKGPMTTILGLSKMTLSLLDDLARRGFVSADDVHSPPTGETVAHPRTDEVVVFMIYSLPAFGCHSTPWWLTSFGCSRYFCIK